MRAVAREGGERATRHEGPFGSAGVQGSTTLGPDRYDVWPPSHGCPVGRSGQTPRAGDGGPSYRETHDRCAALVAAWAARCCCWSPRPSWCGRCRPTTRTSPRSPCCTGSRGPATSPSPGTSRPTGSVGAAGQRGPVQPDQAARRHEQGAGVVARPEHLAGLDAAHHRGDRPRARGRPDAAVGLRVQERHARARRRGAAAADLRPAAQRARPPRAVRGAGGRGRAGCRRAGSPATTRSGSG